MTELKCPSCGSSNVEQIDANRYQCPYCGRSFTTFEATSFKPQFNNAQNFTPDVSDEPGCLMNGLCFLVPLVGIVSYFVSKETYPKTAKSYLMWAIVGLVVSFLFSLILILLDC